MLSRVWFVALVAVTSAFAGCGGSHRPATASSSAESAVSTASNAQVPSSSLQPVPLPASSFGPTTCTVFDGYATQIIFRSETLNVRPECVIWAANRTNVGYLWGYERAAAISGAPPVCDLTVRRLDLTAIVIEETGFALVSAAEQARARSVCKSIIASGWTVRRATP